MCFQQDYYGHLYNGNGTTMMQESRRSSCKGSFQSLAEDSSISIASDVSSCAKITPPSSFSRLRRSTFDLSDCVMVTPASSSVSSSSSNNLFVPNSSTAPPNRKSKTTPPTLRQRRRSSSSSSLLLLLSQQEGGGGATRALFELAANEVSSSSSSSLKSMSPIGGRDGSHSQRGKSTKVGMLESFLDDFFLGYLLSFLHVVAQVERLVRRLFLDVNNWRGNIITLLFLLTPKFEEPIRRDDSYVSTFSTSNSMLLRQAILHEQEKCMNEEEEADHHLFTASSSSTTTIITLPSPSSSSSLESSTVKDEWGHFADFQDELADEACFIPSCAGAGTKSLTPAALASTPLMVGVVTQPQQQPQGLHGGLTALATLTEEDDEEDEDWNF